MTKILRAAPIACLLSLACGGAEPEPAEGQAHSESGAWLCEYSFDPAEPVVGKNALEAALSDDAGTPLEGATLGVELWMPAHGHGANAAPLVSELGGGHYRVDDLVFEMPGSWEVRLQVQLNDHTDRFALPVSVR